MAPKRELFKGPLRPPPPQLHRQSYTQEPASKEEISVRTGKENEILGKWIHYRSYIVTNSILKLSNSLSRSQSPSWIHPSCSAESKRTSYGKLNRQRRTIWKQTHPKESDGSGSYKRLSSGLSRDSPPSF